MFNVNNIGVALVSLLLTLKYFTHFSSVSIVNFEHVIGRWATTFYFFC